MSQMLHEVAGAVPKKVVIMNDQEVVMELEEEMSIIDVLREKDLVTEIVTEQEVSRNNVERIGERTS